MIISPHLQRFALSLSPKWQWIITLNLLWIPVAYTGYVDYPLSNNNLWWAAPGYLFAIIMTLGSKGLISTYPGMVIGTALPWLLHDHQSIFNLLGSVSLLNIVGCAVVMMSWTALCYLIVLDALRASFRGTINPYDSSQILPLLFISLLAATISGYSCVFIASKLFSIDISVLGYTPMAMVLSDLMSIVSLASVFYLWFEKCHLVKAIGLKPRMMLPTLCTSDRKRRYTIQLLLSLLTIVLLAKFEATLPNEFSSSIGLVIAVFAIVHFSIYYSELQTVIATAALAYTIATTGILDNAIGLTSTQLLLTMLVLLGAMLRFIPHVTAEKNKFHTQSITDSLTQLLNRREFNRKLELESKNAELDSAPLALITLDIDHFKKLNDEFGHPIGDEILQISAMRLRKQLRGNTLLARTGGEEFALLLPNTGLDDAVAVAERLRAGLEGSCFAIGNHTIRVTASFGVTIQRQRESGDTLMVRADRLLYLAKENGRNCVEFDL